MKLVSQANISNMGGGPYGQLKFITYEVELPIPYSFYPEVSAQGFIWSAKGRY